MAVYVHSVFVFSCVRSGLVTGLSSVQGILPTVCMIRSFRLILNGNRPEGPIHQGRRTDLLFLHIFNIYIYSVNLDF
jgi:hypothetical protein